MEKTVVLLKPDITTAGKWEYVLEMYEREAEQRGYKVGKQKFLSPMSLAMIDEFYREHLAADFYQGLRNFMAQGLVIAICIEGDGVVAWVRQLNGATDPARAEEGTMRRRFGTDIRRNAVHGSATPADAEREFQIIWPGAEQK